MRSFARGTKAALSGRSGRESVRSALLFFHRKVRPMKQKGCAASRAEQKLRFPENLDAGVCEAHFCSFIGNDFGFSVRFFVFLVKGDNEMFQKKNLSGLQQAC